MSTNGKIIIFKNGSKIFVIDKAHTLNEEDFYPPCDDRIMYSGLDDIDGGDNYLDYLECFFEVYEDDLFDC